MQKNAEKCKRMHGSEPFAESGQLVEDVEERVIGRGGRFVERGAWGGLKRKRQRRFAGARRRKRKHKYTTASISLSIEKCKCLVVKGIEVRKWSRGG